MTDEELINSLRRERDDWLTDSAADSIEKLLAENAELKKELRQLERDTMEHCHDR